MKTPGTGGGLSTMDGGGGWLKPGRWAGGVFSFPVAWKALDSELGGSGDSALGLGGVSGLLERSVLAC